MVNHRFGISGRLLPCRYVPIRSNLGELPFCNDQRRQFSCTACTYCYRNENESFKRSAISTAYLSITIYHIQIYMIERSNIPFLVVFTCLTWYGYIHIALSRSRTLHVNHFRRDEPHGCNYQVICLRFWSISLFVLHLTQARWSASSIITIVLSILTAKDTCFSFATF